MCKCDPNIRTPYCGRGDCVPSIQSPAKPVIYTEAKNKIVIELNNDRYKMDSKGALEILEQLRQAIKNSI